jgi:hypothetical protein
VRYGPRLLTPNRRRQAGLRGKTQGKAQISERNANYLVNRGGAQAADVAALIMEAHRRVLEQLGVDLELNVELRGEWELEPSKFHATDCPFSVCRTRQDVRGTRGISVIQENRCRSPDRCLSTNWQRGCLDPILDPADDAGYPFVG